MPNQQNYRAIFFWTLACVNGIRFLNCGWTFGIFNSVQSYLQNYIFPERSSGEISLIASITAIGDTVGSVIGGPMAKTYGRRKSLIIGEYIFILGTFLTLISQYRTMVMGRRNGLCCQSCDRNVP